MASWTIPVMLLGAVISEGCRRNGKFTGGPIARLAVLVCFFAVVIGLLAGKEG